MAKAGVMLAFETGGASSARDLPYEVGLAEAYGLDPEEALKGITINPAKMFGVDNEYGSIEVGKVANVIVTTGDPIDIRTLIKQIFIRGQRCSSTTGIRWNTRSSGRGRSRRSRNRRDSTRSTEAGLVSRVRGPSGSHDEPEGPHRCGPE